MINHCCMGTDNKEEVRSLKTQLAAATARVQNLETVVQELEEESEEMLKSYVAQIVAQAALLQNALEVVEAVTKEKTAVTHVLSCECPHCRKVRKAIALLPELRKYKEE